MANTQTKKTWIASVVGKVRRSPCFDSYMYYEKSNHTVVTFKAGIEGDEARFKLERECGGTVIVNNLSALSS